MRIRFQPWQLALLVVFLCAAVIGVVRWRKVSPFYDASRLLAALPVDRATLLFIDTRVLRNSGILDLIAGSKTAEEPDYQKFVEQTGFDYRTDLDAVATAFSGGNVYMLLRGRFDWTQLATYARSQGGTCQYTICTMPGSSPERQISFYPVKADVLALAVSSEPRAVAMISPGQSKHLPTVPPEPVWISVAASDLMRSKSLPPGAQALLTPLAKAQKVTFAIGPQGTHLQIRMEVNCASPQAAADLTHELSSTTGLVKQMVERDHRTPNPSDLSAVLVAGTFQQKDAQVIGTWPVERSLIEGLASAQVP